MDSLRCPICGKTFERSGSTPMPFCSERCRLVDLGRWLGESYAVPVESDPDDAAELPEDVIHSDSE